MASTTNKAIIVTGYIRRLCRLLPNNSIIPFEVIELCHAFFISAPQLFMHVDGDQFAILHLHNQRIQKISAVQTDTSSLTECKPYCHIANISSIIPRQSCQCTDIQLTINRNKRYDGILYVKYQYAHAGLLGFVDIAYPCILLYEPPVCCSGGDTDIKSRHLFASKHPLPTNNSARYLVNCHQFINCEENGIIYEYSCRLYQLKLETADILNNNYCFTELEAKNLSDMKSKYSNVYNSEHTKMEIHQKKYEWIHYLPNLKRVFLLKCLASTQHPIVHGALFDFESARWSMIQDYKYKTCESAKMHYKFGICQNRVFPSCQQEVYIVSNLGHTAKYDLCRNQWMTFCDAFGDSVQLEDEPVLWFEENPNILRCASGDYFACLDVRDCRKQWRRMRKMNCCAIKSFVDEWSPSYFL